jgi:hypothetical protein
MGDGADSCGGATTEGGGDPSPVWTLGFAILNLVAGKA